MQKFTTVYADNVGWSEAMNVEDREDITFDDKVLRVARAMSWADRHLLSERPEAQQERLKGDATMLLGFVSRYRRR